MIVGFAKVHGFMIPLAYDTENQQAVSDELHCSDALDPLQLLIEAEEAGEYVFHSTQGEVKKCPKYHMEYPSYSQLT